jgi:Mrp family chromosome partitioning ATPase
MTNSAPPPPPRDPRSAAPPPPGSRGPTGQHASVERPAPPGIPASTADARRATGAPPAVRGGKPTGPQAAVPPGSSSAAALVASIASSGSVPSVRTSQSAPIAEPTAVPTPPPMRVSQSAPAVPAPSEEVPPVAWSEPSAPVERRTGSMPVAQGSASDAAREASDARDRVTDLARRRLLARRIATQVVAATVTAGAKSVLICSVDSGAGKSTFLQLVAPELQHSAEVPVMVFDYRELAAIAPPTEADDVLVYVDGPAMIGSEEILQVPDAWMRAFSGAIIVVNNRKTDRDGLTECVAWLRASGITPLGVIYNEFGVPPVRVLLKEIGKWSTLPVKEKVRVIIEPILRPLTLRS